MISAVEQQIRLPGERWDLVRNVVGVSSFRVKIEVVAQVNILESPEKSISMPGDSNVPLFARSPRAVNVADGTIQRQIVGTFQHRNFELD